MSIAIDWRYYICGGLGMVWLLVPGQVAAGVIFNTLEEPYDIYELPADVPTGYSLYGELVGYPDTYQFTLTATTSIMTRLYAVDQTVAGPLFSSILVADEGNRGVREVSRMTARSLVWSEYQDPMTKMRYQRSDEQTVVVGPGTYRLEVSTPDNEGAYRFDVVGERLERPGYWSRLTQIRAVQAFHGYGWWHLLRTSVIVTPLVFFVLVVGMIATWHYARRRRLV